MSSICRVWCVLAEIFVRVGVWNELVGGDIEMFVHITILFPKRA